MRFTCLYCKSPMIVISRPSKIAHKTENEQIFTVYLTCKECGATAKSQQHLIMRTKPIDPVNEPVELAFP